MSYIRSLFVDDLSAIWKRWSIKIMALQVVVLATWGTLSTFGLTPTVPEWAKWGLLVVLSAAALTAAPFKQSNLPPSA